MNNEYHLMSNEYLCRLAQSGDSTAQDRLIKNLLPSMRMEAVAMKKDFSVLHIDLDDLLQESMIGLWRAIRTFRGNKEIRFQTYATKVAQNAMLDYIRKHIVSIPSFGPLISLDDTPPSFDPSSEFTYADILINEYAASPEQLYIRKETILKVREVLGMISNRDREYLFFRYGFIDGIEHDRTETAFHFHLTLSRATNLEKTALKKCKRCLRI